MHLLVIVFLLGNFFAALNSAFIFGKCHSKTIQMTFLSLFISWTEGWFERYSLISRFGPSHSSTFFLSNVMNWKCSSWQCPPLLINLKWIPHHYVFLFNDLQNSRVVIIVFLAEILCYLTNVCTYLEIFGW